MGSYLDVTRLNRAICKGEQWLEDNKQTFLSVTDNGIAFKDNFADLLILELTKRWDYVDLRIPTERWNYFAIKPVIVPADYPDDNDTNAVAFSVLKPVESRVQGLLDQILECQNSDGIIQVHLDASRPRIAPEVSANIIALFYTYKRGGDVKPSLHYLEKALELPEYEPSRYYFLPEPLLYYTWRLLCIASGSPLGRIDVARLPEELRSLKENLSRRVQARIGVESESGLCPAIRLLICDSLGIENYTDVTVLLNTQDAEGSFGEAWYVRYGSAGIKISHRGIGCVMAITALHRMAANIHH